MVSCVASSATRGRSCTESLYSEAAQGALAERSASRRGTSRPRGRCRSTSSRNPRSGPLHDRERRVSGRGVVRDRGMAAVVEWPHRRLKPAFRARREASGRSASDGAGCPSPDGRRRVRHPWNAERRRAATTPRPAGDPCECPLASSDFGVSTSLRTHVSRTEGERRLDQRDRRRASAVRGSRLAEGAPRGFDRRSGRLGRVWRRTTPIDEPYRTQWPAYSAGMCPAPAWSPAAKPKVSRR